MRKFGISVEEKTMLIDLETGEVLAADGYNTQIILKNTAEYTLQII